MSRTLKLITLPLSSNINHLIITRQGSLSLPCHNTLNNMTIEQITAINNGMSMLADIAQYAEGACSFDDFKEYIDKHVKALKDSGVHEYIVEHFESLIASWIPVARQSEINHMRWADCCEDFDEIEMGAHKECTNIPTPEEDLIALQELKAKLEANNSSL